MSVEGFRLRRLTIRVTEKGLKLLSSLASNQLFYANFIDFRLRGDKSSPDELNLERQPVKRLQLLFDQAMPTLRVGTKSASDSIQNGCSDPKKWMSNAI